MLTVGELVSQLLTQDQSLPVAVDVEIGGVEWPFAVTGVVSADDYEYQTVTIQTEEPPARRGRT